MRTIGLTGATRRVPGTRISVTSGPYMGCEGTGYNFGAPARTGDFSTLTHGYYQGSDSACEIEIPEGVEISEDDWGVHAFYPPGWRDAEGWLVEGPIDASEAIARGVARVAEP